MEKLIQAFGARFVKCSAATHQYSSIYVYMDGETLHAYSDRYLELYNVISGNNKLIAVSTFKLELPLKSKLMGLLTKQPLKNMHQVMR